ncbi:hypothetical protein GGR57DRAFT_282819 [Xylariaceae sp. FL1272]|nr:hypothetical protein GGR57DRAFT_282819 [Xylariaceae sp. FL1272]
MSKSQMSNSVPELTPSPSRGATFWVENKDYRNSSRRQHLSGSHASHSFTDRMFRKTTELNAAHVRRCSTDSRGKAGTNNEVATQYFAFALLLTRFVDGNSTAKRKFHGSHRSKRKTDARSLDAEQWQVFDFEPITGSSSIITLPEELDVSSAVRTIITSRTAATIFLHCFASSVDHGLRSESDQSLWQKLIGNFNADSHNHTIQNLDMAKSIAATLCSAPYHICIEQQSLHGDRVLLALIAHCRRFFYQFSPRTIGKSTSLAAALKADNTSQDMIMTNSLKTIEQKEVLMEILKKRELEKTSELRRLGGFPGKPERPHTSPQNQPRSNSSDTTRTYSPATRQTITDKRPPHSERRVSTMQSKRGPRTYQRPQSSNTQLHTGPWSKRHTRIKSVEAHPIRKKKSKKGARGTLEKSLCERVKELEDRMNGRSRNQKIHGQTRPPKRR